LKKERGKRKRKCTRWEKKGQRIKWSDKKKNAEGNTQSRKCQKIYKKRANQMYEQI